MSNPDPGVPSEEEPPLSWMQRLQRLVLGAPRNLGDRSIFHKIALIPLLAWIGLGSDALSSCAYGPEEAFKALMGHEYLALPLALATVGMVVLLVMGYSALIESFPYGGGYGVATRMLGRHAGLVAGAALVIDYILTIAISVAAAAEAILSLCPSSWMAWKMPVIFGGIGILTLLNLRGAREPILVLAPIFAIFLLIHAVMIGAGLILQTPHAPEVARTISSNFTVGWEQLGALGMMAMFLSAFVIGGGTYTGIEAVSNGLPMLREPRVQNAKRTLVYIAVSLAIAAAGLILCYLLWDVHHVDGITMNAQLASKVMGDWWGGPVWVWIAMASAAALLIAAAQAGFLGGPRVVSNMAVDGWMPRRFTALSERLTTGNAVLFFAVGAGLSILVTNGVVHYLVILYALSVFLTFFLSMLGMLRYWATEGRGRPKRARRIVLFASTAGLCGLVLVYTMVTQFTAGAWIAIVAVGSLCLLGMVINAHYRHVSSGLIRLYRQLEDLPCKNRPELGRPDSTKPVAVVMISGYNGVGIHTVLNAFRSFPHHFKGCVFVSVAVIDSGHFKGEDAIDAQKVASDEALAKYVGLANGMGLPAESRLRLGVDVVDEAEDILQEVARDYPKAVFFAGKVIFRNERWYHRLLHNDVALAIQRRLQLAGRMVVVVPTRIV